VEWAAWVWAIWECKKIISLFIYGDIKMKLRPLDDRIIVRPEEAEEKTAGGIVLPDTAKEKPLMGKVIAVGPGKLLDSGKRAEVAVKKNDTVLFAKYGGNDIKIDGVEYKILHESDILGIVEK
jgi:chaperonin GroES